jgi:hypothetical protein
MPADPLQDFELIPWHEWLNSYWIATISEFEPLLFVQACKHLHEEHTHGHIQKSGHGDLRTAFIQGVDGNTYKEVRRHNGTIELLPVYKLKQAL